MARFHCFSASAVSSTHCQLEVHKWKPCACGNEGPKWRDLYIITLASMRMERWLIMAWHGLRVVAHLWKYIISQSMQMELRMQRETITRILVGLVETVQGKMAWLQGPAVPNPLSVYFRTSTATAEKVISICIPHTCPSSLFLIREEKTSLPRLLRQNQKLTTMMTNEDRLRVSLKVKERKEAVQRRRVVLIAIMMALWTRLFHPRLLLQFPLLNLCSKQHPHPLLGSFPIL